jgi:hypothetical protein
MTTKREPDSFWLTELATDHVLHVVGNLNEGEIWTNARALSLAAGLDPIDILSRAVAAEAVRQVLGSVKRKRKRDREREALLIEAWHLGMIIREMRRRSWEDPSRDALLGAAEEEQARQLGTLPHVAWSWGWNPRAARRRAASDEGRQEIRKHVAEMFATTAGKQILSFLRRHSEDDAAVGRSVDPMPLVPKSSPDAGFLKGMSFETVSREARSLLAREKRLIRRLNALIDGWAAAANPDT